MGLTRHLLGPTTLQPCFTPLPHSPPPSPEVRVHGPAPGGPVPSPLFRMCKTTVYPWGRKTPGPRGGPHHPSLSGVASHLPELSMEPTQNPRQLGLRSPPSTPHPLPGLAAGGRGLGACDAPT